MSFLRALRKGQWRRLRYLALSLPWWRLVRLASCRGREPAMVTIIIPVKNGEATLAETLLSIRAQSLGRWEAVIVDDGSTDGTPHIIAEWLERDDRVRTIRQESLGVSSARNRGLLESRSPWVLFLDADDWLSGDFLDCMFAGLASQPQASVAYCGSNRILSDGTQLAETPGIDMTYPEELQDDPVKALSSSCPLAIHSIIVRRQAILDAGLFDENLKTSEDWDLWLRVARLGAKFVGVPLPLAWYRLQREPGTDNNMTLIRDANRVLRQARRPDPRIIRPDRRFAAGVTDDVISATAGVNLYFAGVTAGAKVSPSELLAVQSAWPDFTRPAAMRDAVRDIEAGLAVGARCPHDKLAHLWSELLPYVVTICNHLEQTLPEAENHCLRALEAHILSESDLETPRVLRTVRGLRIDLGAPLPHIEGNPLVETLYVRCQVGSRTVCELWLYAPFSVPAPILARHILSTLRSAGWRARLKTATCVPALLHQARLPVEDPLPDDVEQVARVVTHWKRRSFQQAAADGGRVRPRPPEAPPSDLASGRHQCRSVQGSIPTIRPAPAIPVLMYHSIADEGTATLAQWRLSPATLAEQLKYLHAHGYYSVTSADCLTALRDGKMLSGRPVLLTFDDGYRDFVDNAWPLLQHFGFRAEVFLVTDRVGGYASWDARHGPPGALMDWDEAAQLQAEGVIFGSHMATHRRSPELSLNELVEEASRSRFTLQAKLGIQANTIAIPFGACDERLTHVLRWAGYDIAYTTEMGAVTLGMNPLALPRVEVTGDETLASFHNKLSAYAA